MVSGDKLKNVLSCAYRIHLIKESHFMHLLTLQDDLMRRIIQFKRDIDNNPKKLHYMICEGGVMEGIIRSPEMLGTFMTGILPRLDFALFFSMNPTHKKNIVAFLNNTVRVVTLAIGDGYNDAQMLREAKIGVAVAGVEGSFALQVCDYFIPEFKDLWRLLFVHGRWSYQRITHMILIFFYRNVMFIAPQILFCFYNGFTMKSLYNEWHIIYFNLVFNTFPILVRAVFDQDIYFLRWSKKKDKNIQIKTPLETLTNVKNYYQYLYYEGLESTILNPLTLILWIVEGLVLGGFYFLVAIQSFSDPPLNAQGYMADFWCMSLSLYFMIIITVDIKIGMVTQAWGWFNWAAIFITSIGLLFLFVVLSDLIQRFSSFNTIGVLFSCGQFYLLVILAAGCGIVVSKVIRIAQKELSPKLSVLYQSIIHREQESETKLFEDTVKAYKLKNRRRATSQSAGNKPRLDPQGANGDAQNNSIMQPGDQSQANLVDQSYARGDGNNASMY